jgi:hypothetical protein
MAQQDGSPAGLCRPWEPCWQSRDCAGLGSGAQQDRVPAGLCRHGEAWSGGDLKCLWIPDLKGSSHRDPAGLRGGSLG